MLFSFQVLPDQGRDHVRTGRVEVITRTIKVHRQQEDRVVPILLAVSLRLHQQHFLCQPVRRIGLFGVTVPQVFLFKRDRGVLGIGADRADGDEFAHALLPGVVDQLHAHHQVVIEKLTRLLPVSTDTAYFGSQVDDHIRPGVVDHTLDISFPHQVIILVPRHEDFFGAVFFQFLYQMRAQKAGTTRNADALSGEVQFLIHDHLD